MRGSFFRPACRLPDRRAAGYSVARGRAIGCGGWFSLSCRTCCCVICSAVATTTFFRRCACSRRLAPPRRFSGSLQFIAFTCLAPSPGYPGRDATGRRSATAARSAPSLSFFHPTCSLLTRRAAGYSTAHGRALSCCDGEDEGVTGMDTAAPSGHLGPPPIMRAPSRENFSTRRYDFSSLQKFGLHCMRCVRANVYRNRCNRINRHNITIFYDNAFRIMSKAIYNVAGKARHHLFMEAKCPQGSERWMAVMRVNSYMMHGQGGEGRRDGAAPDIRRILKELMHMVFYRAKRRVYDCLEAWIARYRPV